MGRNKMNKIITILLVFVSCLAFGQGATPSLRAKILGYYKFENNVLDESNNDNDGTATDITYTSGKRGDCAVFNGTSSYVDTNTDFGLENGTAFSVSGWIYATTVSSDQYMVYMDNTNARTFLLIRIRSDSKFEVASFGTTSGHFNGFISSITASINTWYNITAIYNGSRYSLYVDGVFIGQSVDADPLGTTTGNLWIGRRSTNYLSGRIDELSVYNRELSSLEIELQYNSGNGLLYVYENFKNDKISFQEYLTYYLEYLKYNS